MPLDESPRRPGWRTSDVARTAIVGVAVYAAARLLYAAHNLVFVAYLGVLLGLAVSAGSLRLRRFGIPQGLGSGLIVMAAIAILVGFGAWTGPTVRSQYRELRERLPEAFAKLDRWVGAREGVVGMLLNVEPDSASTTPVTTQSGDTIAQSHPPTADSLAHLRLIRERIFAAARGERGFLFPVIHSTIEILTGIVVVLFLTLYIGADPDLYHSGIISLMPHRVRQRGIQVLDAIAIALRRWLVAQLIAMITIGVVTTLLLVILNVRAAIPLGILAGLLQFVPMAGPILSSVPAILMGFVDSPEKAAAVAVAFYIIHFLESHLLIPILMKEGVDLPPVLTILTQATMALAFGVTGLFVAVPVLVLVTILVKMLYVEDVVGDRTSLPYVKEPPPVAPTASS